MFSLSYGVIFSIHFEMGITEFILYFIGPWSAYILGKVYIKTSRLKNSFIIFITILSLGMYLHGILNVIAYVRSEYILLYQYYRQSVDFWRNELVNVKTTEMLFTFATGISLGVVFTTYKAVYKIIASLIIAFSIFVTIFFANRTLMIIFFVILLWRGICWFLDKKVPNKNKIIASIIILTVLLLLFVLISLNIGGLGDSFYTIKIVQRFFSDDEYTRFDVWDLFIKDFRFVEHPFGGNKLVENEEFGYLHNMWLDVYNIVGAIPMILLIVFTIAVVIKFFNFRKITRNSDQNNIYIIFQSLILAVFMNMMVEPIIEANPYYFLISIMFFGAMDSYMNKTVDERSALCFEK